MAELSASEYKETTDKLIAKIGELKDVIDDKEQTADAKAKADQERKDTAAELDRIVRERDEAEATAKAEAHIQDLVNRAVSRASGSKAHLMGYAGTSSGEAPLGFFMAVAKARSRDAEEQAEGKAVLREHYASAFASVPAESMGTIGAKANGVSDAKATLGTTNAAGGFIMPRNFVDEIERINVAENPYRRLLTVRSGIRAPSIDIPYSGAPARAVVAAWGTTKQNRDLAYGNYSATFYTIAAIYDVSNQFLRFSAGAAEDDVREALGEAFRLGEAYYILNGSGTNEPKGILTSLAAAPAGYTTTRSGTRDTVAGSVVRVIAQAAGVLADRAQEPDGIVLNTADYWSMVAEGTDNAGFFFTPAQGPSGIDATRGELRVWGRLVLADPNMVTDTGIIGRWKGAKLYQGDGYRVDVSSEAGTRWDQNLTGFRGEEEIAFNADPYVYAGRFQRISNVV